VRALASDLGTTEFRSMTDYRVALACRGEYTPSVGGPALVFLCRPLARLPVASAQRVGIENWCRVVV
jgi:hypothetical protein